MFILLLLLLLLLQNKTTADGRVARLTMTSEDERQLLAENPALRQVYEAQASNLQHVILSYCAAVLQCSNL
jgi:hypothetical protein